MSLAYYEESMAAMGLTPRPVQLAMIEKILADWADGRASLMESPCGSGKTTTIFATPNPDGRVIISSFTNHQASQTAEFAERAVLTGQFDAVRVIRGAQHYICWRRAATWMHRHAVDADEARAVLQNGWREELEEYVGYPLNDFEWRDIRCDRPSGEDSEGECSRRACTWCIDCRAWATECGRWSKREEPGAHAYSTRCGVDIARDRARAPGIIVPTNHACLTIDVLYEGAILGLGPDDVVVVDEAHRLPGDVRSRLSGKLSRGSATGLEKMAAGAFVICPLCDGLLGCDNMSKHRGLDPNGITTLIGRVLDKLEAGDAWRTRNHRDTQMSRGYRGDFTILTEPLTELAEIADAVDRVAGRIALSERGYQRAHSLIRKLRVLADADPSVARWLEPGYKGMAELNYEPVHAHALLRRLERTVKSVVYMSATLQERADEIAPGGSDDIHVLDSPFDLATVRRGAVIAGGHLGGGCEYEDRLGTSPKERAIAGLWRHIAPASLIITTREHGEDIASRLAGAGWKVRTQWEEGGSEAVNDLLTGDIHVFVGTESVAEGVDIPGDALLNVFIGGLRWPPPSPRTGHLVETTPKDQWAVMTPTMELATRQAIGRLIRSMSDRGTVYLLDGRELQARQFEALMAPSPVERESL